MKRSSSASLSLLEKTVLVHVAVLLLGSTWAFGGNIWWARQGLSVWASLSIAITLACFLQPGGRGRDALSKAWWLLPPLLFAVMVIAGSFNPCFSRGIIEGDALLIHTGPRHPGWPTTANAADSLRALWFGAGAYLSAFNLSLAFHSRRGLRLLLVLTTANALALAVFGTVQKLAGAGFYFGAATSPNVRFFSTFIYNNHWGAFMILNLTIATGLLFYHAHTHRSRDLWHSPFTLAVVGVLLIAATAPVSASRAATLMAGLLLVAATVHAAVKIAAARRREQRPVWPPVALLLAVVLASGSAVGWLAFQSISSRYNETRAALKNDPALWSERAALYRDTWSLVRQKPVFGWGLDSYGITFQLVRPRSLQPSRQYESSYETAHNDWLQSLAENGFVGTGLLLCTLSFPLTSIPRRSFTHPLVAYPLLGLGVVLAYAGVEFPFSSAAVLVLFWVCVFVLVRYATLQREATTSGTPA